MQGKAIAENFIEFINEAVTPFHAVSLAGDLFVSSGFERLHEHEPWILCKGGKYFVTRNESSIFAFAVGEDFTCEEGSFRIIGTHTDSPCPKLAPHSKVNSEGFVKLNVMLYGGGLWNSWFDRDLTLAGRVVLNLHGRIETQLIHIKRPIVNIPELAIHLSSNREKFEFNKESHLKPILCSMLLENKNQSKDSGNHPNSLLKIIAKELSCEVENISDLELLLIDTNPSQVTGLYGEFISSPRLDNLMSCYCAMKSLIQSKNSGKDINMWAAYDHEEIGSVSMTGADSVVTSTILKRILSVLSPGACHDLVFRKSFALSADMAHGVHPNYREKHHPQHGPRIHGGVVLKINADQNYATDCVGSTIVKALALRNSIPLQEFIVKNDSPCGSTIGPMLSANTGIRVVDVGAPQLAMHSCRELMGCDDAFYYHAFMKAFYDDFHPLHDTGSYQ